MEYEDLFFKRISLYVVLVLTGLLVPGTAGICFARLTQQAVLVSVADNGIKVNLSRAARAAVGLEQAVRQLCETHPDSAALTAARVQWRTAYLGLVHGPAFYDRFHGRNRAQDREMAG